MVIHSGANCGHTACSDLEATGVSNLVSIALAIYYLVYDQLKLHIWKHFGRDLDNIWTGIEPGITEPKKHKK